METTKYRYTFWKLITDHKIEIPIIQRDYAQGRPNIKATQIRQTFINALISSFRRENVTGIHLDFVYGKIEGKTNAINIEHGRKAITGLLQSLQDYSTELKLQLHYELKKPNLKGEARDTVFIPLDGQQRLTMLFLLHWYLSARSNGKADTILSRFSYRTRRYSKEFCKALVENIYPQNISGEDADDELSEAIMNTHWFLSTWKKDPTVRSMLTVLDDLHHALQHYEPPTLNKMLEQAQNEDHITFDFLDMNDFHMTDELYVKMNARGKPLTDFENFKAWLQDQVIKENINICLPDWHQKMDLEWTDIFWQYKQKGVYEVDAEYLSYIKMLLLCFYAENLIIVNRTLTEAHKATIENMRGNTYVPHSFYSEQKLLDASNLNHIFTILFCTEGSGLQIMRDVLHPLFLSVDDALLAKCFGQATLTLPDRLSIYALVKFLIRKQIQVAQYTAEDRQQLFRWIRITKNLINNTIIDDDIGLVTGIREINKLSEHCFDIYQYLLNDKPAIGYFLQVQVAEEIEKVTLIDTNPTIESIFLKYENHEYFCGQLSFLIHFATKNGETNVEDFVSYADKAAILFSEPILKHPEYLLQRAILCKGDYFVDAGNNKSFCIANKDTRSREENWRRFLRNSEKVGWLKEILQNLTIGQEETGLRELIAASLPTDWRRKFISHVEIFQYASFGLVRFVEQGVYILSATKMPCYYVEIHSYSYFLENKHRFPDYKLEHYFTKSFSNDDPGAIIYDIKIADYLISFFVSFKHTTGSYLIQIYDGDNRDIEQRIAQIFSDNGYEKIEYFFEKEVDSEAEVTAEIESLLQHCNKDSRVNE